MVLKVVHEILFHYYSIIFFIPMLISAHIYNQKLNGVMTHQPALIISVLVEVESAEFGIN